MCVFPRHDFTHPVAPLFPNPIIPRLLVFRTPDMMPVPRCWACCPVTLSQADFLVSLPVSFDRPLTSKQAPDILPCDWPS